MDYTQFKNMDDMRRKLSVFGRDDHPPDIEQWLQKDSLDVLKCVDCGTHGVPQGSASQDIGDSVVLYTTIVRKYPTKIRKGSYSNMFEYRCMPCFNVNPDALTIRNNMVLEVADTDTYPSLHPDLRSHTRIIGEYCMADSE